jgi:hypothetical protein
VCSTNITHKQNVKLRDMVSEILEFQCCVEYIPRKEKVFADYLIGNCMDKLYSYPKFEKRKNDRFITRKRGKDLCSQMKEEIFTIGCKILV